MTESSAKHGPKQAEGEDAPGGAGWVVSVEAIEMLGEFVREAGVSRSQLVRG